MPESTVQDARVQEMTMREQSIREDAVSLTHSNGSINGATQAVSHHSQSKAISFDEVRQRVQGDDKGKWDIVLPRSELMMQGGRIMFPDAKAYECEDGLVLSTWATGQFCQRLNIPTAYFRRCPAHLQDVQFNHWATRRHSPTTGLTNGSTTRNARLDAGDADKFYSNRHPSAYSNSDADDIWDEPHHNGVSELNSGSEPVEYQNGWSHHSNNGHRFHGGIYTGAEKSEYWLLRAKDDTLRAVLTDKYTPLDNRTLMDVLHKVLPPHLQVQWVALDDESFHLRIVDPTMGRHLFADDRLTAGIHLSNSEVGKRSVTVDALVYRQVCSNGLIKLVKGKSLLSQRHVAVSPPHFVALLRQGLTQALSTAQSFLTQMEHATALYLDDVEAEMKSLVQHWHLSQGFVEQIKASLKRERSDQQETVFGLTNALTAAAQTLDAEARYDLEVMAGKLLERKSMQGLKGTGRSRPVNIPAETQDGSPSQSPTPSKVAEAIEAAEVLFEAEAVHPAASGDGTSGNEPRSEAMSS